MPFAPFSFTSIASIFIMLASLASTPADAQVNAARRLMKREVKSATEQQKEQVKQAEEKETATEPQTRPETKTSPRKKSNAPTRTVKFMTEDNIEIVGTYIEPDDRGEARRNGKAPVVILLHMYQSDRSTFEPLFEPLHEAGFASLAIDMRGHGESTGPKKLALPAKIRGRDARTFRQMYKDVDAAYVWLSKQPDVDLARFGLIGASVGCSVALDYASKDRSVDAVVCMTPGIDYLGLNSRYDVRFLQDRKLLLLASEPENKDAEMLAEIATNATTRFFPYSSEDKMALHGTRMFGQVENIEKIILDFLIEAVGPPPTAPVAASRRGRTFYDPRSAYIEHLDPSNLRWFSSPKEATDRGLHPPRNMHIRQR